jgi:hypothetical protein
MVNCLLKLPDVEISIIDNNSSYIPLLKWYKEIENSNIRVIRLTENLGHLCFYKAGLDKEIKEDEYFCLTDPDLDISNLPSNFLDILKNGLSNGKYKKCGLFLEMKDLPDNSTFKKYEEDEQYEKVNINGIEYIKRNFDTTFGMYKFSNESGSILTNESCKAIHIPWYYSKEKQYDNNILIDSEYAYYVDNCNASSTTKNKHSDVFLNVKKFKFSIVLKSHDKNAFINSILSIKQSHYLYDNWNLFLYVDGDKLFYENIIKDLFKDISNEIVIKNNESNLDIKEFKSDYFIIMENGNCLYPNYLKNLNLYFNYSENKDSYSHFLEYYSKEESYVEKLDGVNFNEKNNFDFSEMCFSCNYNNLEYLIRKKEYTGFYGQIKNSN